MVSSKSTDKLEIINNIICKITNDESLKMRIKTIKIDWTEIGSYESSVIVPNLVIEMKD